jgi:hypothetical protein
MGKNMHYGKPIIVLLIFFVGFWGVFKLLQHPNVYAKTLGKISQNYECTENGDRIKVSKSYIPITDTNIIQWDGAHYQEIKDHGYVRISQQNNDYIFAFFPLFSAVWRLSSLSGKGICFLNFILFTAGILLLFMLFKKKITLLLLVLSLPLCVVFLIPYTEATFFFVVAVAVWGYMKDKYPLCFAGLFLAALTRNACALFFPAFICAEILFLLKERTVVKSLKRLTAGLLPLLLGTATMITVQVLQGSNSIINFMTVQQQWGHVFSLPDFSNLTDWSHESFGMNVSVLITTGIPLLIYLAVVFLKHCRIIQSRNPLFTVSSEKKEDYLLIVSLFCCVSAFCMVLLFQHGNLHGLSRFILASPCFVTALFLLSDRLQKTGIKNRIIFFGILSFLSFAVLKFAPYGSFSFSYLGCFIFLMTVGLYLFQASSSKTGYKTVLYANFGLNILWSTYLFNMYISNGWIYL